MKWKSLFFVVPAIAIIGLILTWNMLVVSATRAYLDNFCTECLGKEMVFSLQSKGLGVLEFDNLSFETHESLEEGGLTFSAQKVTVAYRLQPLSMVMDVDVTVESPDLELSPTTDLPSIVERLFKRDSLFTYSPRVKVANGTITLNDTNGPLAKEHRIFYATELNLKNHDSVKVSIGFDDPSLKTNSFDVAFFKDDNTAYAVATTFRDVDFAFISEILGSVYPPLESWIARQGAINGNLAVIKEKGKRVDATGKMSIKDLVLQNPNANFKAKVGEAFIDLRHGSDVNNTTMGKLEISQDAQFVFEYKGSPIWEVKGVKGGVSIESHDGAVIDLAGECSTAGHIFNFSLNGDGRYFDEDRTFLALKAVLKSQDGDEAMAQFDLKQLNDLWYTANIRLQDFGYREFQFVQEVMRRYSDDWDDVRVYKGTANVAATANIKAMTIQNLNISSFSANEVVFDYYPWEIYGRVGDAKGTLTVNLAAEDILQTLNTELVIDNALARFLSLDKEKWQLTNIHTKLACSHGVIQKSIVKGILSGLEGTMQLDLLSKNEIAKVKFMGNSKDISHLVPERIKRGINEKFGDDTLTLSAGVRAISNGVHIEGLLEVEDRRHRHDGDIAFGFDVEKVKNQIQKSEKTKKKHGFQIEEKAHDRILQTVMPAIASPALALKKWQANYEQGLSGFVIRNGWIYAENLPLAKYVEPFAFQQDGGQHSLNLGGVGDFRGVFDHLGVGISYDVRNFSVESDDFLFQVENFYRANSDERDLKALAIHFSDFTSGRHFGKMPIKHGTYLEKNSGLLFTEISSQFKLEGMRLHASELDTFCQGIHFAGNINIDTSLAEYGAFDVEILAETMDGKVSQVQKLFSHFDKPFVFTHFPMEGDLRFRNDGGYFLFNIRPEESKVTTRLEAILTDGIINFAPLDMSLHELELNIDYDQRKNILVMDNIHGSLLVGSPDNVEEYLFAGDSIAFSDFENNIGSFDLWIGDKKRDIIRVAGTTTGYKAPLDGTQHVSFHLDNRLTHFGDVYPKSFKLALEDWTKVEAFNLDLHLNLETLLGDLQRVSRSGAFFLSPSTLKELNDLKEAQGDIKLHFDYDNETDMFHYDSTASDIAVGPYHFGTMQLTGKVKDKIWSIDQFRVDDTSIAAEVAREEGVWRVHFLGLRSGQSLLLGLEGDYYDGADSFDAKVNLFEVNFNALHEWPQLIEFVQSNSPKGVLKGKGRMSIQKSKQGSSWGCDGSFTVSSQGMMFRNMALADASGFSCHFISDKGLTLRKIKTALLSPDGDGSKVALNFERISYNTIFDELEFDGVHFVAPYRTLKWFPNVLQKAFPDNISDRTVEIVSNIKSSGNLIGSGTMKVLPSTHLLTLSLANGNYFFDDNVHKIKDFFLSHDPKNFLITTQYQFRETPLRVKYRSVDPKIEQGTIHISENDQPDREIAIQWEDNPTTGFNIKEAKGAIRGLQLHLTQNRHMFADENYYNLNGWVQVSFPHALTFFESELQEPIVENKISGNYLFNGNWSIAKNDRVNTRFQGDVEAKNFLFKGFQIENLQGNIDYSTNQADIRNLTVSDPAGQVVIPNLNLTRGSDDQWHMSIPSVNISSFRPSYLRDLDARSSTVGKALIMPKIEVFNVKGLVGDSMTWLGEGMFTFKNPPRKSLQNTIFAIPHEIITRIGLNPAVLTPVTGSVIYEIKNGKIIFTKFKDIYSESRGSKFYLPRSSFESYIDFDKNLYVQVRMKQYNLLFKLAELFTFTIKGTLDKPIYTIHKQDGRHL